MRTTGPILILLVLFSQFLNGQYTDRSLETAIQPELLQEVFNKNLPDLHARKIHGRPYFFSYPKSEDNQFFQSGEPLEGIILTLDDTIHCSLMLYDLCSDRLVIWEPAAEAFIEPEEEFIRCFWLNDNFRHITYEFRNIVPETNPTRTRSGFHQVLFDGKGLQLHKKHTKVFLSSMEMGEYVLEFKQEEKLIRGEDIWIKRNRDLWRNYPGIQDEIKRFLRDSGIKLQRASDRQIYLTGQFVEGLLLQPGITDPG